MYISCCGIKEACGGPRNPSGEHIEEDVMDTEKKTLIRGKKQLLEPP